MRVMRDTFDPTAWNMFVGAALVAGCGSRVVAGDDETSTSESTVADGGTESTTDTSGAVTSETDTSETDTSETDTSEADTSYYDGCLTDEDCSVYGPGDYDCIGGICLPAQACAHHWYCPEFDMCFNLVCHDIGTPPPSCGLPELDIPVALELDGKPLALTFADLDDDGRDELLVQSENYLFVYESGWNIPTTVMGCEFLDPYWPPAMAGGQFDDQPGEDIAVVADDSLITCFSDGVGGVASQSVQPIPLYYVNDVIVGDFDGQPPMDLLPAGESGAVLVLNAGIVALGIEYGSTGAAAFDFGTPHAGLALIEEHYDLHSFDLSGAPQSFEPAYFDGHRSLARIESPDAGRYVLAITRDAVSDQQWYEVVLKSPLTLVEDARIVLSDAYWVIPGDFDGDQVDEIFVTGDDEFESGTASVVFGMFTEPCIAPLELGTDARVMRYAVGDHDGDGDDEVALMFEDDTIMIVDVE
jgi:hypothetical protein